MKDNEITYCLTYFDIIYENNTNYYELSLNLGIDKKIEWDVWYE